MSAARRVRHRMCRPDACEPRRLLRPRSGTSSSAIGPCLKASHPRRRCEGSMPAASRSTRRLPALTRALMLGPALLALPVRVAAQGAEEQVLPPIVVQGATLEAPPARPRPRPRPAVGDGAPATTQAAPQGGAGEGGEPAAGEPAAGDAAGPAAATGEAVAGVPAERVGSAVTVVTSEELRAQQIRHAADALRSLPGVSVSRGCGFRQRHRRARARRRGQPHARPHRRHRGSTIRRRAPSTSPTCSPTTSSASRSSAARRVGSTGPTRSPASSTSSPRAAAVR